MSCGAMPADTVTSERRGDVAARDAAGRAAEPQQRLRGEEQRERERRSQREREAMAVSLWRARRRVSPGRVGGGDIGHRIAAAPIASSHARSHALSAASLTPLARMRGAAPVPALLLLCASAAAIGAAAAQDGLAAPRALQDSPAPGSLAALDQIGIARIAIAGGILNNCDAEAYILRDATPCTAPWSCINTLSRFISLLPGSSPGTLALAMYGPGDGNGNWCVGADRRLRTNSVAGVASGPDCEWQVLPSGSDPSAVLLRLVSTGLYLRDTGACTTTCCAYDWWVSTIPRTTGIRVDAVAAADATPVQVYNEHGVVPLLLTPTSSSSQTSTPTSTLSPTSTLTPGLACPSTLFHRLARADLVGAPLTDAPLAVASEGACRIACCAAPGCDGFAFAFTELRFGAASCFLLANVTSTTPANAMASGLLVGVALPSAPASASPAQTPLPAGGWPRRGGSTSPTSTPPASPSNRPTPSSVARIISTIAGTGAAGSSGDGGPASSATIQWPTDIKVTSEGDLLVLDQGNCRVRRVAASSGIITTVAGSVCSFCGDGGPASSACFYNPVGFSLDSVRGGMYLADSLNHRVRRVDAMGTTATLAGTGAAGFSGDSGPATSATLNTPYGVIADADGNVFIADLLNHCIRRIDAITSVITTYAGSGGLQGLAGDGGQATSATMGGPTGLVIDVNGDLIVGEQFGCRIRKIAHATRLISTLVGGDRGVCAYSGDGPAASATIGSARGLALDAAGNLLIASGDMVLMLQEGYITRVAGGGSGNDGGAATSAGLATPYGVAADSFGNVYVADEGNQRVRMISSVAAAVAPTPSPTPYCAPQLFRKLPRLDLVGDLVGTALYPGSPISLLSEGACRQSCCDAPACDGYSFASGDVSFINGGPAGCFLYVNITQLIPNSGYSSGIVESTL